MNAELVLHPVLLYSSFVLCIPYQYVQRSGRSGADPLALFRACPRVTITMYTSRYQPLAGARHLIFSQGRAPILIYK